MIIDCTILNNELDVLMFRLQEHNKFVDKFIITEAKKTHSGLDKELYYENNKERFSKFHDKIIHLIIYNFPEDVKINEQYGAYQRNYCQSLFNSYEDTDVVINTDIDEIINHKCIDRYNINMGIMALEFNNYYYYLNCYGGKWINGSISTIKDIKDKTMDELRFNHHSNIGRRKYNNAGLITDIGWHFSWLGGEEAIINKYKAGSSWEGWNNQLLDKEYVEKLIKEKKAFWSGQQFDIVSIDDTYPEYIVNNQSLYQQYIYIDKEKYGIFDDAAKLYHHHSERLVRLLSDIIDDKYPIYDLGCGDGYYINQLIKKGYYCIGYEGNPPIIISYIKQVNLAEKQKYNDSDNGTVICLEVGEHIPKEYEDVFIENVVNRAKNKIIISWANPNQGGCGHVNEQSNYYIINKFRQMGYVLNFMDTNYLRDNMVNDELWWFKNTLMVFDKEAGVTNKL